MTSLVLLTALAFTPAQTGGALKLTNVRTTYGELGGTRPEAKYLPGDVLFVGFDIEGLTISEEGRTQYRMGLELFDKNKKSILPDQQPTDKVDYVPLGGPKLPARAYILIGVDQDPGTYTMKLTVTDTATKAVQTLEKSFEVMKKDFGIVAVYPSVDESGRIPAPTTGVLGQSVFIQFAIVGFARDPKAPGQPSVTVEMTPLDAGGKPTLQKSALYKQNADSAIKLEPKDEMINVRFLLPLSREGKYTVRLKATDEFTKKSITFDLPIVVVPSAN